MENLKMSNSVVVFTIILGSIFGGCASTGYITAPHNGKLYYVPKNCGHYKYVE